MRRILALLIVTITIAMTNTPPAEAVDQMWFSTLLKASEFADGVIGEAPHPSSFYLAYREALLEPEKISEEQLQTLQKKGSPEGKLYAACLAHYSRIARKNAADADKDLKALTADHSKVFYRSGCLGTNTTVSEVASALLDKKKFLNFALVDFSSFKNSKELPSSILKLFSAKRLENSVAGEGARSRLYAYYKEARELPLKTHSWEIYWLRRDGTPAAKLYAGFLMLKIDESSGVQMFRSMENDNSKVQYQSGCEVETTTVGAVAKEVVQKKKYLDFEI